MQQGVQTDARCNTQHVCELLAEIVASVCSGLYILAVFSTLFCRQVTHLVVVAKKRFLQIVTGEYILTTLIQVTYLDYIAYLY